MNLPKSIYDKNVPSRNLISTIPGLITLVLSVLVALNVITIDQSGTLQTHLTSLLQAGTAAVAAIVGIIGLFKKDSETVQKLFRKKHILMILFMTISLAGFSQIDTKHLFGTITPSDIKTSMRGQKAFTTSAFLRLTIAEAAYEIPLKKESVGQYFAATGIGGSLAFYKVENGQAVEKYTLNLIFFTPNIDPASNLSTALTIGVPIPKIDLPILNAGIRYAWKEKIAYLQTSVTLEF
jgi:hypothetical protein